MKRARVILFVGLASACAARTEIGGVIPPSPNSESDADTHDADASQQGDVVTHPPPPCTVTQPTQLASGGQEIQFIALDGASVYWTDFAAGTVSAVPKNGGATRELTANRQSPSGLVIRDGTVMWAEFIGDVVASTDSTNGGAVTTVATNQDGAFDITAVGTTPYWTTTRGCTVARRDENGKPEILDKAKQPFTSIVSTDSLVFWVSFQKKSIERFDIAAQATSTLLATGSNTPITLATDGTNVYFGESSPNQVTIGSISTNGGTSKALFDAACSIDGGIVAGGCLADITTDGQFVYFTAATDDTSSGGLVRKVPIDGGQVSTVADHQSRPFSVAVDDTCVYWSNLDDGSIWAAPK